MTHIRRILAVALTLVYMSATHALAQAPAKPTKLPETHEYQRVLRAYVASLTEKDLSHGVTAPLSAQPSSDAPDYVHRNFVFTLMNQPIIGSKRGYPSVNATGRVFTLAAIETPEGVIVPPCWPESLTSFTMWDYPGNPYYNNRALKLRALVTGIVNLVMLDDYLEKNPDVGRTDWYSYELVLQGVPFLAFRDQMPPEARKAYADGLKKYARRLMAWGPTGNECNFDLITPIGLWYAMKSCDDPGFAKECEAYAKMMFTDPRYFHPAGYWVERGGLDMGYAGMANYFAIGAALTGDWPFAKEAVERVYRLRAHLSLPEPDGTWTGPTHFNTRLGSTAINDQWQWRLDSVPKHFAARDYFASLVTDEAAYLAGSPTDAELKELAAAGYRAGGFNGQLHENPVKSGDGSKANPRTYFTNEEIKGNEWVRRLWQTWDFPASMNWGYEFYPRGALAHRRELEASKSPMLKSPYEREGSFVRDFAKAFFVTKQPGFAAILHTGPVGAMNPTDSKLQFSGYSGPLGLGGGELSAFWTPATGSVILGRRGGNKWQESFDKTEAWRTWPIHAVCGQTGEGKFFTSARILKPEVASEINGNLATVKVAGAIPPAVVNDEKNLQGVIEYAREFKLDDKGVSVTTTVKGDGEDNVAELYEVIPVFHRDSDKEGLVTKIEFQAGGAWGVPTDAYTANVTAIRLSRFSGAVTITFDTPRRAKLAPSEWKDTYLSQAVCRNVLIDLLESGDKVVPVGKPKSVRYHIAPSK